MRKLILAVLVVVWVMLALSALGIDIGPLLAGAGVVGLALGFGAQTLVRDVASGIFFLLDDAFRVGESIEAGPLIASAAPYVRDFAAGDGHGSDQLLRRPATKPVVL